MIKFMGEEVDPQALCECHNITESELIDLMTNCKKREFYIDDLDFQIFKAQGVYKCLMGEDKKKSNKRVKLTKTKPWSKEIPHKCLFKIDDEILSLHRAKNVLGIATTTLRKFRDNYSEFEYSGTMVYVYDSKEVDTISNGVKWGKGENIKCRKHFYVDGVNVSHKKVLEITGLEVNRSWRIEREYKKFTYRGHNIEVTYYAPKESYDYYVDGAKQLSYPHMLMTNNIDRDSVNFKHKDILVINNMEIERIKR